MADSKSAVAVARDISKAVKRTVTDKQVRTMARAFIPRFSKADHPAYQGHAYDAAESAWMLRAFVARSKGQPVPPFGVARKRRTARPTTAPEA